MNSHKTPVFIACRVKFKSWILVHFISNNHFNFQSENHKATQNSIIMYARWKFLVGSYIKKSLWRYKTKKTYCKINNQSLNNFFPSIFSTQNSFNIFFNVLVNYIFFKFSLFHQNIFKKSFRFEKRAKPFGTFFKS